MSGHNQEQMELCFGLYVYLAYDESLGRDMDKYWIFVILYCSALTYLSLKVRKKTSTILMWYTILVGCVIGPWIVDELSIAVGFYERTTNPLYYIGYISASVIMLFITAFSIVCWDLIVTKYLIRKKTK